MSGDTLALVFSGGGSKGALQAGLYLALDEGDLVEAGYEYSLPEVKRWLSRR